MRRPLALALITLATALLAVAPLALGQPPPHQAPPAASGDAAPFAPSPPPTAVADNAFVSSTAPAEPFELAQESGWPGLGAILIVAIVAIGVLPLGVVAVTQRPGDVIAGIRRPRALSDTLPSLVVVGAAVVLALAVTLAGPRLVGDLPVYLLPVAVGLFLVLPGWMLATHRHHLALAVLLVYLGLIDGVLKLQSTSEIPGLGRDIMIYAIAVGMLVRAVVARRPLSFPPLTGWIVAFTATVLVQLLNPANGSLIHSIASTRQHLEFIPLFFVAYAVMRSMSRVRCFLLLLAVVAALNGIVSIVQLGLSPEQLAAWGPGYEGLISGETGAPRTAAGGDGEKVVRPFGLGSDFGFGGILGVIAIPGAIALLATRGGGRTQRILAVLLVLGAVAAVATSLSRSHVISGFVVVLVFAVLVGVTRPRQLPAALAGIALVGVLSALVVSQLVAGNENSFARYSSISPGEAIGTTIESRSGTISQIPIYAREFPLGAGIGSVGPAAGVIDPPPPKQLNAESQFTFLLVELGLPGTIVFFAFQLALLAVIFRGLRRARDRDETLLLAAVAAPLFAFAAQWIVGVTTVSSPNAPYLWFAAGLLVYWLSPAPDARTASAHRSRSQPATPAPSRP